MAIKVAFFISSICSLILSPIYTCANATCSGWHTGLGVGYVKSKNVKDDKNKIPGSLLLNPYFGYDFKLNQLFLIGADVGVTFTPNMEMKYTYNENEQSTKLKSNLGGTAKLKLGVSVSKFDIYGLVGVSAQRWVYDVPKSDEKTNNTETKKKFKFSSPSWGLGIEKSVCDHFAVGVEFTMGNRFSHKKEDLIAKDTPITDNPSITDTLKTKNLGVCANLKFKL